MEKKKRLLKMNLQHFADGEMSIKSIHEEVKTTFEGLKGLIEKQNDEIKSFGTTTDETAKEIKSMEQKLSTLGDDLKEVQTRADEIEKKFGRGNLPGGEGIDSGLSLGEKFIASDQFKQMIDNNSYTSAPMSVKSIYDGFGGMEQKQLTTAQGSGGALVRRQQIPVSIPSLGGWRIRNLIPVQPTDSNSIEYVQESGFINNARTVAELQPKPESHLAFDVETESVKTIAHFLPASRQVLADANQLRAYIDNRLIFGLMMAEEQQILYGDGTSPNLQGILTHDGIQSYTWDPDAETKIDAVLRAITQARIAEYPVTGIIMHPNDFADIQLQKADNGQYIWANVSQGGEDQLWAVPVVTTTAIAEGEALAGAFQQGAMLWDREQANIRVGEPMDYFTRNMVSILAEQRMALTIFRPEAFVGIDFTGGTPVA